MTNTNFLKVHSPRIIGILFLSFFTLHFFIRTKDHLLQYIPLKCPSFFLFSIKCPMCGLGHAILEANRLNYALSVQYHVLGILVYCYLLLLSLSLLFFPTQVIAFHIRSIRFLKSAVVKINRDNYK